MPVRHDAIVFPKFFTTNKKLDLPYLPFDPLWVLLGENRSLQEQGSLCFQLSQKGDCIQLSIHMLGSFKDSGTVNLTQTREKGNSIIHVTWFWWQSTVWLNGTFPSPNWNEMERPHQTRIAPHCGGEDEGELPPWTDCQSSVARWIDEHKYFTFSPNMLFGPEEEFVMRMGLFLQDHRLSLYHKWLLCGINGSCTDLNPLVFLKGGAVGKAIYTGLSNYTLIGAYGPTKKHIIHTEEIFGLSKTQINQTNYISTPVCDYPPFLFILSNDSFENCVNDSCWISQCWDATKDTHTMVAQIPRWIPVPVETPSTLSLF